MVHSRRQTGRKTDTKVKSTELQPGEGEGADIAQGRGKAQNLQGGACD
jgi:hypothetical protein